MQQQSWIIGFDSNCDIVVDKPTVSGRHCLLDFDGEMFTLVDLDSTNGTVVNGERLARSRIVTIADTITLGQHVPMPWPEEIQPTTPTVTFRPPRAPIRAVTSSASPNVNPGATLRNATGWIAGVASVVMAAIVVWNVIPEPATDVPGDAGPESVAGMEVEQPASTEPEPAVDTAEVDPLTDEEQLTRSLFAVVCRDTERQMQFRVGTAFAIDSQHVATTASVVNALQELEQNGFRQTFLYSPVKGDEIPLGSIQQHPEYEQANREARAARQEYDSLLGGFDENPPDDDELEIARERLILARVKAFDAIEQQTIFDVAVIEVETPLTHWIPAAAPGSTLRPNLRLSVTGLAFDVEDPFFDPAVPLGVSTMSSRVSRLLQVAANTPQRMLAIGSKEQLDYAYLGSPALNAQGEVVAVYSRPTPHAVDADELQPAESFDAPLFARVHECLAESE